VRCFRRRGGREEFPLPGGRPELRFHRHSLGEVKIVEGWGDQARIIGVPDRASRELNILTGEARVRHGGRRRTGEVSSLPAQVCAGSSPESGCRPHPSGLSPGDARC